MNTPWNPSQRAMARVINPLPTPTRCPNCGSKVEIICNSRIYGKKYGKWPWTFQCVSEKCNSYVGMHPFTNIPLGTLADTKTRQARKRAKAVFNPLWQNGPMSRKEAYQWLASALNIVDYENCHIGWFDVMTCDRIVDVITMANTITERRAV
jgi:hypothetical protein